jgi:glycosyltransferase involved in cell wall biosynthesis
MARAARNRGIPYVIAPHGMLETWALERSRLKKKIAAFLYQRKDLEHCSCLQATARHELERYRACELENPVAVVPNGIDVEQFDDMDRHRGRLVEHHPELKGRPLILFLSRIHPKKGIPNLIGAWQRLRQDFPDWAVIVAGPDEVGQRKELEREVEKLGLADSFVFTGPQYGDNKLATFADADIFVLPSFSEGFSMAILEALGAGLPVVITHGCNFPEVADWGIGQVVEANPDGVERGLRTLMEAPESERQAIGARAHDIVRERYSWAESARKMTEVYRWLCGEQGRPACVDA